MRERVWASLSLAALLTACGTPATQPTDVASLADATVMDTTSDGAVTPTDVVVATGDPTYWRDIKPLVDQHCVQCHTAGEIGPMALSGYEDTRNFARLIVSETAAKRMPPWMPSREPGCRPLQDPRGMTDAEIARFARWVELDTPEGNMADYVAPMRTGTSRPLPATGDVSVQPPEAYMPTTRSTDDYHCFVMDPGLTAQRDVVGVRVTPGNARMVHHVILFEVREAGLPALQRLDDAEPGPGYTCFGNTGVSENYRAGTGGDLADFDVQMVVGWAPGGVPGYLPSGTGIRLKPGSRLVMQVHYNLNSSTRGMTDRSRVELYYGDGTQQQALWLPQVNSDFRVPAGAGPTDARARAVASFNNTLPVRIFGVAPHMHTRGHSIRVDNVVSGTPACLVDLPRWDFHWQQSYFFTTPLRPGASTLRTTCVWDNTAANQPLVDGVMQSPRELRWGEGTNDEMCLNFYYISI